MRKLITTVLVALMLPALPVAAVLSHNRLAASPSPSVAPELERQLNAPGADATEHLVVFVHGTSLDAARNAVTKAGLDPIDEWASIDVVVAGGVAEKVRRVVGAPGVTYVEPNTRIEFQLDTARIATRTAEAQARAWPITEATTEEPSGKPCDRPGDKGKTPKKCAPQTVTTTREVGPFLGAGRSIAIVDSGIDGTHPMFVNEDGSSKVVRNLKLVCMNNTPVYFPNLAGQGQFPPDTCPADPETQDRMWVDATHVYNDTDTISAGGHGTHVAGIAAGNAVTTMDRELSGTAPGASLVGLSIGGGIGIYGANTALDWISRHHDKPCGDGVPAVACPPITVVNNSYGTVGGGEFNGASATAKLQRLLVNEGIVMVWANGNGDALNNGGNGSDNRSNPPAQDQTPGIISVANYDDKNSGTRDGGLHSSSSRGMDGRPETYPDLSAPGTGITSACRAYLAVCATFEDDPDYGTIGGTSMAAPHVAGIVATLQEAMVAAGKDPSPSAIEDLLKDTAYKFAFGAPYEDPNPEDTDHNGTTSFDKGHGLVDTYNAMSSIFGLAPSEPSGGSGPTCSGTETGFADAAGDANMVALAPADSAYDPRLDLVSMTITGDSLANKASFVFGFAEVDGRDPSASPGLSAELTFSAAGASHTARIFRSVSRGIQEGNLTGNSSGATVVADDAANTITLTVPTKSFGTVSGPVTLSGLGFRTRRDSTVSVAGAVRPGPVADDGGAPCPVTVDIGTTPPPPPPPPPDPSTYDAKLERGGTFEWQGSAPVPVNAMPISAAPQCVNHNDPRCDRTGLWIEFEGAAADLRIVFDFDELDDFDVFLFDSVGREVARKATDQHPEVLTATLSKPGVYYVAASGWFAMEGGYSATATLL